jgi:ferritin-like metal-binding protein YciE
MRVSPFTRNWRAAHRHAIAALWRQRRIVMSPVATGSIGTLRELLVEQLNELYAAEKHYEAMLPKLADSAASPKLAEALRAHLVETKQHVARLERVFGELSSKPKRTESGCSRGLMEDCRVLLARPRVEAHVRDAAIIAAVQHVEHDEMAGYGCAKTWATMLGMQGAAAELAKTLAEEKKCDADLSRIAETLNKAALEPVGSSR